MRRASPLPVLSLTVAALAGSASAETITVCSNGCDYTSINAAIAAATGGDVIQLAAETYFEGEPIDMLGKSVTLLGVIDKKGNPRSIIDGDDSHGVLKCTSGETSLTRFENIVIRNGAATTGGGLHNLMSSSPTLTNCMFDDNYAGTGGAVTNDTHCHPTFDHCVFRYNGSGTGGGMFNINFSSPVIKQCAFVSNGSSSGGGMYNWRYCHPIITNTVFMNNGATEMGGGMRNVEYSDPILADCIFTGNTAGWYGGGMYNYQSSPRLQRVMVCENMPDQIDGSHVDVSDNYVSCHCPGSCQADLDCDEQVGASDLGLLIARWATDDRVSDLDGDGEVRAGDLGLLIAAWGLCP